MPSAACWALVPLVVLVLPAVSSASEMDLSDRLARLEQGKALTLRRTLQQVGAHAAARRLARLASGLGEPRSALRAGPATGGAGGPGCTVGLLSYQQRGDRLSAIAGPPGRLVESVLPAGAARVQALARTLLGELETGAITGGGYQAPLVELRRALWDPVEPALAGCRQVVVSSVGPVAGLPLHALITQPDPRRALPRPRFRVERVAFTDLPTLARWTAAPAGGALSDEAIVAPAAAEPELGGAALELRDRQRRNPRAVVHVGPRATGKVLLQELGRRQRVHVLAHGERATSRLTARLRLGDRAVVPAELARASSAAGLVVLSGCEMAPVPGAGDGSGPGFVPALLAAGARRVLAAFLAIRDGEAAELMAAFDGSAGGATGLAEALAQAQRQRIARLEAPHPRLWAGHALFGGP